MTDHSTRVERTDDGVVATCTCGWTVTTRLDEELAAATAAQIHRTRPDTTIHV